MVGIIQEDYRLGFIRGATTANGNSVGEIESAVVELINELLSRNSILKKNVLSITFTVTRDLDACFPASIARKCFGLDSVALMDCQQMHVDDD
ncbi:chorismate mutase, partial [Prochlorococcus sp. AH-736-K09]|nr:chorismate mutase [Prochlorococcus sp. AH-736-K09]